MKRLLLTGCILRSRTVEVKSSLARRVEKEVWALFINGHEHPAIDQLFPVDQAVEALRLMNVGSRTAKISLQVL